MTYYDISIAYNISKLKAGALFTTDTTKQLVKNTDCLIYQGVYDDEDDGNIDFTLTIPEIQWKVSGCSGNYITLTATFTTDKTTLDTHKTHTLTKLKDCKVDFNIYIDKILNTNRVITKQNWYELQLHLEPLGQSTYIYYIQKALQDSFQNCVSAVREIFFDPNKSLSNLAHEKITQTHVTPMVNTKDISKSYLCIGQMIDNRQPPTEASFPANEMKNNSDFIIHLSPYMYMKMGVYKHLQQSQSDITFKFSEDGRTLENDGGQISLSKSQIASSMKVEEDKVLEHYASKLKFTFDEAHFTVSTTSHVKIDHETALVHIPFWGDTDYVPDDYCVDSTSKQFYNLGLKDGDNGKLLNSKEEPALRENNSKVTKEHPEVEIIAKAYRKFLEDTLIFDLTTILPIAADIAADGNPIVGVLVSSVCQTLGDYLEDRFKEGELNQKIAFYQNTNNLQVSFQKQLPFKLDNLKIIDFKVNDGVVFTATL